MPLVKFFLIILAPVAVPLAKVLDYFLEEDVGTVHTKNEMMHDAAYCGAFTPSTRLVSISQ